MKLSNGHEMACHALLLSSGMAVRELEGAGLTPLIGAGVYYGAALRGATYRGQRVFVLGGANSAGQGAMFFARYAADVTLIVRKPSLLPAMSSYLADRIKAMENISVLRNSEIRRSTAARVSSGWMSTTSRLKRRKASTRMPCSSSSAWRRKPRPSVIGRHR